jgi:hypothetical protein
LFAPPCDDRKATRLRNIEENKKSGLIGWM